LHNFLEQRKQVWPLVNRAQAGGQAGAPAAAPAEVNDPELPQAVEGLGAVGGGM
jgi:hypothetical protein